MKNKEARIWTTEQLCNLPDGMHTTMKCSCGNIDIPAKSTSQNGFMLICIDCGNVDGFDTDFVVCKRSTEGDE